MRVHFNDIFNINNDQQSVSPKRLLRLAGVKLTPELILYLGKTEPLGFDISQWIDKEFEVDIDQDVLIIKQVILSNDQ